MPLIKPDALKSMIVYLIQLSQNLPIFIQFTACSKYTTQ